MPILLPQVGPCLIHRVHFGIVLTMALILGIATPPLGIGLFVATRISGARFENTVRDVVPYFIPLTIVPALLLLLVLGLSVWLPGALLGPA